MANDIAAIPNDIRSFIFSVLLKGNLEYDTRPARVREDLAILIISSALWILSAPPIWKIRWLYCLIAYTYERLGNDRRSSMRSLYVHSSP